MRYWFIVLGIVSSAYAYDPQLSMFANASPSGLLNPGLSVELANTYGLRTVVAGELGITEPTNDNERDVLFALNGRLLYSTDLTTQWYPQIGVSWLSQARQLDTWLGLGLQSELTPEVGYFADANWRAGSDRFAVKLGIRLWLARFSSLDARVRYSDPVGYTYRPGASVDTSMPVDNTVIAPAVTEPPTLLETETFAELPELQVSTDAPDEASPIVELEVEQIEPPETNVWYVHLGLFEHSKSMDELVKDIRLAEYKDQITPWFDPSRAYIRLLMGPYEKTQAQVMLTEIKRLKLDGFLFQKPN